MYSELSKTYKIELFGKKILSLTATNYFRLKLFILSVWLYSPPPALFDYAPPPPCITHFFGQNNFVFVLCLQGKDSEFLLLIFELS